jgi:hypothetical protein
MTTGKSLHRFDNGFIPNYQRLFLRPPSSANPLEYALETFSPRSTGLCSSPSHNAVLIKPSLFKSVGTLLLVVAAVILNDTTRIETQNTGRRADPIIERHIKVLDFQNASILQISYAYNRRPYS